MKNYFLLIVAISVLAGCSQKTKQKLGLATTGPNEYSVERAKSLEVPPQYDLPAPGSME